MLVNSGEVINGPVVNSLGAKNSQNSQIVRKVEKGRIFCQLYLSPFSEIYTGFVEATRNLLPVHCGYFGYIFTKKIKKTYDFFDTKSQSLRYFRACLRRVMPIA
jgi:hypothetical protein